MKNIFANWRTSYIGIGMIVAGVTHLCFHVFKFKDADENMWKNDLMGIAGGFGLIYAGDAAASASKAEVTQVKDAVVTGNTEQLKKPNG